MKYSPARQHLLPLINYLGLNVITIHSFDEESHAAMIALDNHTSRDLWIARKIDGVFAFGTYAQGIFTFYVLLDHI